MTGELEEVSSGWLCLRNKDGLYDLGIVQEEIDSKKYVAGEKLKVYYSGLIQETYPSRISKIYKIKK
ncbi:hypothetical protein [Pseudolactococcus yaeyamensis]